MTQDIVERAKAAMADHEAFIVAQGGRVVSPGLMPELVARIEADADTIAALRAELAEARRRRDEWKAKAEGFDAVRAALREKVGAPWPPNLSRVMWAGIAADEKARAEAAEARADAAEAKLAALEPKGKEAW